MMLTAEYLQDQMDRMQRLLELRESEYTPAEIDKYEAQIEVFRMALSAQALAEENARMRAALEHYADDDNYPMYKSFPFGAANKGVVSAYVAVRALTPSPPPSTETKL